MGRRRVAISCLVAGSALVATASAQETRTVTQPFIGVTLTRIDTMVPRRLSMNLVEIDLTIPGIGFAVTPSNGAAAGETVGLTTRQFLTQQGVQLAVNGGFSAWVSGSNYNVEGLAARQGVVYSEFQEFRTFALNISPDNVATIIRAAGTTGTAHSPATTLHNTLAGEGRLLRNGTIIQYDNESNHPRTGVGLSADETKLYVMTVDGRNSSHSLGVTRPELADFMRMNGVHNAINLDGGGSTTLVVADPQARLVNVPVGVGDVPGTERVVGSNFGVFALPMPVPAAVTINVAGGTSTQAAAGHPFLVNALSLTKTGTGTLVLDAGNSFTTATEILGGTLRLARATGLQASPTSVRAGARLDVAPGLVPRMPSLVLAAGSALSGSVTLGPGGIRGLTVSSTAHLSAATLAVAAGGTATVTGAGTLGLGGLAVDPAGRLEIGSAGIQVAAGGFDLAAVRAAIVAGVSGSTGITSSIAATTSGRAVGWLDNGDGSLTVAFAAAGDWNVNGVVDFDDVVQFVSAGRFDTGLPATWAQGDYDTNGVVDFDDVVAQSAAGLFDAGPYNAPPGGMVPLGLAGDPGAEAGGFAAVPEPATWVMLLAGAARAAGHRRRPA